MVTLLQTILECVQQVGVTNTIIIVLLLIAIIFARKIAKLIGRITKLTVVVEAPTDNNSSDGKPDDNPNEHSNSDHYDEAINA